jgi:hypothetical protein
MANDSNLLGAAVVTAQDHRNPGPALLTVPSLAFNQLVSTCASPFGGLGTASDQRALLFSSLRPKEATPDLIESIVARNDLAWTAAFRAPWLEET